MQHDISYYRKIQDAYEAADKKQALLHGLKKRIQRDFKKTVNWENVTIGNRQQELLVMKSTDEKIKKIEARPNEILRLGEIVKWHGIFWLITELDYDNQIQYAGTMTQCNTILRWQLEDGSIHYEYGVAEDATKYGTGLVDTEYLQLGEFSLKVKVQMNEYTLGIRRDRRFLIGENSPGARPLAYITSRLNQVTGTYISADVENEDGEEVVPVNYGYIEVTLLEDVFREDKDRADLWIADYFDPGTDLPEEGDQDAMEDDELW